MDTTMKIMIGLLGKPDEKMKSEGGLLESDTPEALMDNAINSQNKAIAVEKAMYGPSNDKMRRCGNCEYFETKYDLKPGEGFCDLWKFKAVDKAICAGWEFNKPESDNESEMED